MADATGGTFATKSLQEFLDAVPDRVAQLRGWNLAIDRISHDFRSKATHENVAGTPLEGLMRDLAVLVGSYRR